MAEDSVAEGFGKVVLGGAVGFALYYLITGLGLGGGRGGDGRGALGPYVPPFAPPPPVRSKDEKRLSFLMTAPTAVGYPMGFQLRDGGKLDPKIYSLDELIARVQEGGRSDVDVRASGAVIQGPWNDARDLIKRAGLTLWTADTASSIAPAHVGNDRGQYGRRSW